jgi:hypothetical protein
MVYSAGKKFRQARAKDERSGSERGPFSLSEGKAEGKTRRKRPLKKQSLGISMNYGKPSAKLRESFKETSGKIMGTV